MINKAKLHQRLIQPTSDFASLGETSYHDGHQLTYIDNGGSVLAVCHLDTVLQADPIFDGGKVIAPQLDDRLGAYIILDLLPSMGLKYDLLLCDAEEIGQSTARNFIPPKAYNWAFEFDRQGTDSVLYDYESSKRWFKAVAEFSRIGMGSFSDISDLTPWGFCAVNWGCGYHMQHTLKCYANLIDTVYMVKNFINFFNLYENTVFPYRQKKRKKFKKWGNYWSDWK